jgi:hypothetical protein
MSRKECHDSGRNERQRGGPRQAQRSDSSHGDAGTHPGQGFGSAGYRSQGSAGQGYGGYASQGYGRGYGGYGGQGPAPDPCAGSWATGEYSVDHRAGERRSDLRRDDTSTTDRGESDGSDRTA